MRNTFTKGTASVAILALGMHWPGGLAIAKSLWEHDNLHAWCVVPFDAKQRGPEERARMLENLGFRNFAYDGGVEMFDAEIAALNSHRIHLLATWFPFDAEDAEAKATLEAFKRHHIHPQLWVMQSLKGTGFQEAAANMSREEIQKLFMRVMRESLAKTPREQELRIEQQVERISALVRLAAPYGSKVELYNHNGWLGMVDNQIAVIQRLRKNGIMDVGIVYNFGHARDELHDDTVNFPALWKKIKPYVVAVNVTGIGPQGEDVYPSQGNRDLEMLRTIQRSGWKGPVGLIAEKGGDAEVTLKNYLIGLDWLAAEIGQPGSGGRRPFPRISAITH